ncbi:MAG: type II toxin-antitoxin system VapC family toxin [Flammeovirgaceae bacterium]
MTKYLFDTNIISYFIGGKYPSLNEQILRLLPEQRFINWVVQQELMYGVFRKERLDLEARYKSFFEVCNLIQSDFEIVEIAAKLEVLLDNKGESVGLEDIWIGATCLSKNMILITNNEKHFQKIPNLKIENWIKE